MGDATFGKYRLIAELGHGGMADVFLAVVAGPVGSGFSKLTVVKRLRQNLAEEPEFVEMLVDEARISARLNHPNVVQTNEVGSVGNQYFLAMEYLDGQPLHRIQHRALQKAQKIAAEGAAAHANDPAGSIAIAPSDPFPKECHFLVLADSLAGLHHAHELADYDGTPLQIVHRDVTPHNIFVTYEGQTKVVDFGIAKAVGRASETRQGVVKGKVRYMAPEQAIGQRVDRRADLFSVGVMLWEAATGKRLWQGMDDLNIVQILVAGKIQASPREVDPTVPEEIDRICRKALATNPEDRYATAEDFRLDIEQFLAEKGLLVNARRKLGAAVTELFNDKRTEIKAVIEKQLAMLKAAEAKSASEMKPVHITLDSHASGEYRSSTQPMQPTTGRPASTTGSSGALALTVPDADSPTSMTNAATEIYNGAKQGRSRGSKLGVIAAAAVLVLAVGGIALSKAGIIATGSQGAVPTAAAEPAVHEVKVKLSANPSTAAITVDGRPVTSPFEAKVPRDNKDHYVRVEAPGFDPHVETVRFETDVTMVFTLTKPAPSAAPTHAKTAPVQAAVAAPPPVAAPQVKPPPVAAHEPSPPVTAAAPPTTAPTTAGSTGHPSKGPKPAIDPGDPWGSGGR